ncbi:hypothetical protein D3C73_568810 [compost metagenome]
MVDHKQPYGERAQGDEGGGQWTQQRNESAQHMGNHQRTEGDQRLQRMEKDETAALFEGEKNNPANEGEKVTEGSGDMIRYSGRGSDRGQGLTLLGLGGRKQIAIFLLPYNSMSDSYKVCGSRLPELNGLPLTADVTNRPTPEGMESSTGDFCQRADIFASPGHSNIINNSPASPENLCCAMSVRHPNLPWKVKCIK